MKRKLILLGISMTLFSCQMSNTPKCSDEQVKKLVLEMLQERMKGEIKNDFILKNLNYSDIRDYAYTNNLSFEEVKAKEIEKMEGKANQYIFKYFENMNIKNILTQNENKEAKKCNCEATVKSEMLESTRISYSIQIDDEGQYYIVLDY